MLARIAHPCACAGAIALAAGCTAPQPPRTAGIGLDAILAFADPATCKLNDDAAQLMAGFVGGDGDTLSDEWIRPGTVPERLRDRLGPIKLIRHDGWWVIRTEARGELWGLPLVAIAQEFPEGGDPGGFTFEFQAPAAQVERAARARGFPARSGQDVAMGEPDGLVHSVGVHPIADGQRATFGCGYS